eukprot:7378324-Prymnesium_polylepis.1
MLARVGKAVECSKLPPHGRCDRRSLSAAVRVAHRAPHRRAAVVRPPTRGRATRSPRRTLASVGSAPAARLPCRAAAGRDRGGRACRRGRVPSLLRALERGKGRLSDASGGRVHPQPPGLPDAVAGLGRALRGARVAARPGVPLSARV